MTPARSNEPPFDFPGADLEMLAELEHTRWTKAKIAAGWRWAPQTKKDTSLHQDLLPWHRLSDEELLETFTVEAAAAMGSSELDEEAKEKDRALVRAIPLILSRAGYTAVKIAR
jgi:hypothetical protein